MSKEYNLKDELESALNKEFHDKYFRNANYFGHEENGVGIADVKKYPDTELHRHVYPELYNFDFYEFSCNIGRKLLYSWCGYIKVEKNHPLWKLSQDQIENLVNIHGGITYCNFEEGEIGFDCCHFDDLSPFRTDHTSPGSYKDRDYVINELMNTCLQLYNMLPDWQPLTHKYFSKDRKKKYVELYKILYNFKKSSYVMNKDIWVKIVNESMKLSNP